MKYSLKSILVLFFVTLLLASCSKEETKPSKIAILENSVWEFEELKVSIIAANGAATTNIVYKKGGTANRDDFSTSRFKFNSDKSTKWTIVGNTARTEVEGKWLLLNNDTQLQVTTSDKIIVFPITTIVQNSFEFTELSSYQGLPITTTYKLVRIP